MAKGRNIKIKKIILASDHAGFELKENIKQFLLKKGKKFWILEQKMPIQ